MDNVLVTKKVGKVYNVPSFKVCLKNESIKSTIYIFNLYHIVLADIDKLLYNLIVVG